MSESSPSQPELAPPASKQPESGLPLRRIKTFVKRAGRTTFGQARAYELFGPQYLVPYKAQLVEPSSLFAPSSEPRKTVLEIGFGMGETTAHIAQVLPEVNFLCCEVHEPGVGALLKRAGEAGIENIRIIAHDAVEVLEQMLPAAQADGSGALLDGVHIFFPDPWHKTKHNKRRLIQPALVAKLAARLKPGGYIHCATDWEPYAQQMLEVLSANAQLKNTAEGYAPQPDYRPLTKFENRGLRLGHGVWDLVFTRQS